MRKRLTTQRALRDRLMSRGKNCLPTVLRQFLTRNYHRPNCLLKCLPNCLSPTREGFLSSFKINPAVRVIARQVRDKNWERPDLLQSPEMARPGISTKNTEKIPPGPKFRTPKIYPQNTPKIPKKPSEYQKNAFGVFLRYFGGIFLGFQNLGPGGIFPVFFREIPVGPSRGSVAGRGVLRDKNCLAAIFAPRHQSVSSGPLHWEGKTKFLGSHLNLFLRILPFFLWTLQGKQGKKEQNAQKKV